MCNSYYNYQNCCCTSPGCHNYAAAATHCCYRNCGRYQPPLCHREVGRFEKCTCCREIGCARKGLLHNLCPVPGMCGETIKEALKPTKPVCVCGEIGGSGRYDSSALPLLNTYYEDGEFKDINSINKDYSNGDDEFFRRLSDKLQNYTSEEQKALKDKEKYQFNDLVKQMNTWYTKEMRKAEQREREQLFKAGTSVPLKSKKPQHRKDATNSINLIDIKPQHKKDATSSINLIGIKYAKSFIMMPSNYPLAYAPDLTAGYADDLVVIQASHKQLSDPAEVDDHVAISDMRAVLKQVKLNRTRPILFHPPFDRNNKWTWKNSDPLSDMPSSHQNANNRVLNSGYSLWTMHVVQSLLHGQPLTDKKLERNKELRKVVGELAHEIKRRKTFPQHALRTGRRKSHH